MREFNGLLISEIQVSVPVAFKC